MFRSKWLFTVTMLLILFALSFILWQRYQGETKQYKNLQLTLMQQQATQTAKHINTRIIFIRNQMSAMSLDSSWLADLSKFSHLFTVQESMRDRLKLYFPTMHAYSISSYKGEQLGGDIDLFIGEACKGDIKRVATMFKPNVAYFDYKPYLHAKGGAYHFDVMIPVLVQGRKLVFYMSFKASVLSRILKEHIISEHFSYLVRQDIPNLIEVSPNWVRDKLKRNAKLSKTEINHILARSDVPHSRWTVVVVENTAVMDAFKQKRLIDGVTIFTVIFLFWLAVLWFGLHSQKKQGRLFSKLRHESHHDMLTGLANRRKLFKEVGIAVKEAQQHGMFSAILYMDLNGFKKVNDTYGHDVGDYLLKEFASRLTGLSRQIDKVSRMGGDEFVVLLKQLGKDQEAAKRALNETIQRYRKVLNKPYIFNDHELNCKPSIGSILIDGSQEVESLINQADKNMYQEKTSI